VARQLVDAATLFGNVLARLADDDWDRSVVYNYPETPERSPPGVTEPPVNTKPG